LREETVAKEKPLNRFITGGYEKPEGEQDDTWNNLDDYAFGERLKS
jgi:hypothetical protein